MEIKIDNKNDINNREDDSFLFSTSLIFEQNIDKLWLYLRNLESETTNIDFLDDFKFIKGDNTWTVGNIFSMYWIGVSRIEIKCISFKVERNKKKIKWKFKCDIGINYYKTLILYRITQCNKTLVKVIINRTEKKNNLIDSSQSLGYYSSLQNEILRQQYKYLTNIKENIISYESCIINKNYLKVWSYIIDFKRIKDITPVEIENVEYKGQIDKVGSFIKFYDFLLKKTIFLKIKSYIKSEKKKTWLICFETIGSYNDYNPKISEFKLTIINNNKIQFSLLHILHYNSNKDYIKDFNIKKKEKLKISKKFLEENENDN